MINLYDFQIKAIEQMKNGCILCGDVGSGKSITALSYYYLQNGGDPDSLQGGDYIPMGDPPKDLYIITTAHKRDTLECDLYDYKRRNPNAATNVLTDGI